MRNLQSTISATSQPSGLVQQQLQLLTEAIVSLEDTAVELTKRTTPVTVVMAPPPNSNNDTVPTPILCQIGQDVVVLTARVAEVRRALVGILDCLQV